MTTDHREWETLVMGFEHLDEADTERALAHLSECERCRTLRAGLLEREALARPQGALPEHARMLREADRDAAAASLAELLDRACPAPAPVATAVAPAPAPPDVAAEPRVIALPPRPGRSRSGWRVAAWLVPAAAAAVFAVTFFVRPPAPARPPAHAAPDVPPTSAPPAPAPPSAIAPEQLLPASGLTLERDPGLRGSDDPQAWHTGDAFVLRFWLRQSAHVSVWHVGPDGVVSRVYPDERRDRSVPHAVGEIELPPMDQEQRWTFEGESGTETFLVVTAPADAVPLSAVASSADSALVRLTDRIGRLAVLESILEERLGPVARVDVEHLP